MTALLLPIALLFIPGPQFFALTGFVIIGLGCAKIYPCIIHTTPATFGKDKSQSMIWMYSLVIRIMKNGTNQEGLKL